MNVCAGMPRVFDDASSVFMVDNTRSSGMVVAAGCGGAEMRFEKDVVMFVGGKREERGESVSQPYTQLTKIGIDLDRWSHFFTDNG
jgi:hypothetical protein